MKSEQLEQSSKVEYWNNIYLNPSKGGEKGGTENVRFGEVFQLLEGERILDVGAGYAQLCRELKARYPEKHIVAADFSEAAAKASHYKPYVVCNAYDLPFEDKEFDLVISTQLMEYLDKPADFMKQAARVASKGIFTVPFGESQHHNRISIFDGDYFHHLMEYLGEIEKMYIIGPLIVGKVNFG